MSEDASLEAGGQGQARRGAAKRQGAKPPGSGKQPTAKAMRVQFHLSTNVVERLRVHAALSHRADSKVVEEVLSAYLLRHGRGRAAFGEVGSAPDDAGEDLLPV